jgi:hypothetical protein
MIYFETRRKACAMMNKGENPQRASRRTVLFHFPCDKKKPNTDIDYKKEPYMLLFVLRRSQPLILPKNKQNPAKVN